MNSAEPLEIDCPELKQRLDSDSPPLVLDVREPWEIEIAAIQGAISVPLGDLPRRVGEAPSDRSIAVMCHHGGRSAQATAWLRARGFDRAMNVAGGIDAWASLIDSSIARY